MRLKAEMAALALGLTLLVSATAFCAEPAKSAAKGESMSEEEQLLVKSALAGGIVRGGGATDPLAILKNSMTPECYARWTSLTKSMVGDSNYCPEMADFFSGAMVLGGAQSKTEGITAYYSPWQDAILLMKMKTDEAIPQAEDFAFLSGETWRGTLYEFSIETLIPQKDPLSIAIMRVWAQSVDAFQERFPLSGKISIEKFKPADPAAELQKIRFRTLGRLKLIHFLETKDGALFLTHAAALKTALVKPDGVEQAMPLFGAGQMEEMLKLFYAFPKDYRSKFKLYHYVRGNDGKELYVFMHPALPRFALFVGIPGKGKNPTLEYYDLTQSKGIVAAWDKSAPTPKKEVKP